MWDNRPMGNPSPILHLLSGGMRLVLDTPKEGDKIFVDQQETAVATSLLAVVAKYGKFDQDGDGVWAGYKPATHWSQVLELHYVERWFGVQVDCIAG